MFYIKGVTTSEKKKNNEKNSGDRMFRVLQCESGPRKTGLYISTDRPASGIRRIGGSDWKMQ